MRCASYINIINAVYVRCTCGVCGLISVNCSCHSSKCSNPGRFYAHPGGTIGRISVTITPTYRSV